MFQRELLQLAADNRLTVTLHGVAAPTGLERTFPNLLTSEAVLNLEYDKWDEDGVTPEHDVDRPAHADAGRAARLPPGLAPRRAARAIQARIAEPLVIGTPVPDAGLVRRASRTTCRWWPTIRRLIAGIRSRACSPRCPPPGTTRRRSPPGVDEEVVVARRSGNDWWIGAMSGRSARDVRVPLSFLPAGTFRAVIYQDDPAAEHGFVRTEREVSPADTLALTLAGAGGAIVRLIPAPGRPPPVAVGLDRGLRQARPEQLAADRQRQIRRVS